MKLIPTAAASALLVCIGAAAHSDAPPAKSAQPDAQATAAAEQPTAKEQSEKVPQVTIESYARLPVCRRHVPTGSRIATERCTTPGTAEGQHAAARQQFDSLRQQQMIEDQVRQQARAEAMRRRVGF